MGRIFQSDRGSISNITDKKIEKITCLDGIDKNIAFINIFVVWIKLKNEGSYHRIFLDAGACFCSIYDDWEEVYSEDIDNCLFKNTKYELAERFPIKNLTVIDAIVFPYRYSGVKLKINLDNKYQISVWSDTIESESNLLITKLVT